MSTFRKSSVRGRPRFVCFIGNSTFVNNIASTNGGAIGAKPSISQAVLTITNSTFSGNSVGVSGHGNALYSAASSLTLNNNLMIGTASDCYNKDVAIQGANNLSDGTCAGTVAAATNVSTTLANNGGLTQTVALLSGSNAIDAVPVGSCVYANSGTNPLFTNGTAITTDQRGTSRPQGTLCDIGAYEYAGSPTSTATATATVTYTATATLTPTVTSTSIPARIDSVGIYRGGTFYLRLHNTQGFADLTAAFIAGTKPYPVVGDWTGAGFDSIGVMDQATANFYLRNTITAESANETFTLGNPNDTPLSGRWSISATHTGVGVFRPSNGVLYLKNQLTTGFADNAMVMGLPGDESIAGDWTGKGFDSPGVFRPSNIGFYLSNQVTNGTVFADLFAQYGSPTDLPIAGDWIAQGHDGIGMFRSSNGYVYLKNAITTGYADNAFFYGLSGDVPITGHWQLTYSSIVPSVVIPKTATPAAVPNSGSVPGGNGIGG